MPDDKSLGSETELLHETWHMQTMASRINAIAFFMMKSPLIWIYCGPNGASTYIVAKNRKMFNVFAKKHCKEIVNSSGRRMISRFLDDLL
jgi:hypothetical protein